MKAQIKTKLAKLERAAGAGDDGILLVRCHGDGRITDRDGHEIGQAEVDAHRGAVLVFAGNVDPATL